MRKVNSLATRIKGSVIRIRHSVILAVGATSCLVLPTHAEPSSPRFSLPYLGGNVGIAEVQSSDRFDYSQAASAYSGFYLFHNLSIELWLAYLGAHQ